MWKKALAIYAFVGEPCYQEWAEGHRILGRHLFETDDEGWSKHFEKAIKLLRKYGEKDNSRQAWEIKAAIDDLEGEIKTTMKHDAI